MGGEDPIKEMKKYILEVELKVEVLYFCLALWVILPKDYLEASRKMIRKNNYVMRRLNTPKRVTLPNGRIFIARYKRVPRSQLPANVTIRRRYTQRAAPRGRRRRRRGRQGGRGLFDFVKKVIRNPTVRALGQQAASHLPDLFNAATNRIKNEKVRKALQSDTAKHLLNSAVNRI